MSDYEIRLFKPDGSHSIVMAAVANGPSDASDQAWEMLVDGVVKAEIWSVERWAAIVGAVALLVVLTGPELQLRVDLGMR